MTAIPREVVAANRQLLAAFKDAAKLTKAAAKADGAAAIAQGASKALDVLAPALGRADELGQRGALMLPQSSVNLAGWAERHLQTAAQGTYIAKSAINDAIESANVAVHNGTRAMSGERHTYSFRAATRTPAPASSVEPASVSAGGDGTAWVDGERLDSLGYPARDARGGGFGPDGGGYDEFSGRGDVGGGGGYVGPDGQDFSGLI